MEPTWDSGEAHVLNKIWAKFLYEHMHIKADIGSLQLLAVRLNQHLQAALCPSQMEAHGLRLVPSLVCCSLLVFCRFVHPLRVRSCMFKVFLQSEVLFVNMVGAFGSVSIIISQQNILLTKSQMRLLDQHTQQTPRKN